MILYLDTTQNTKGLLNSCLNGKFAKNLSISSGKSVYYFQKFVLLTCSWGKSNFSDFGAPSDADPYITLQ